MNHEGLAGQLAGVPSGTMEQPNEGSGEMEAMLQKVIEALVAGITPEELISKGVPAELVDMAISELGKANASQQQPQPTVESPATEQGLAAMAGSMG